MISHSITLYNAKEHKAAAVIHVAMSVVVAVTFFSAIGSVLMSMTRYPFGAFGEFSPLLAVLTIPGLAYTVLSHNAKVGPKLRQLGVPLIAWHALGAVACCFYMKSFFQSAHSVFVLLLTLIIVAWGILLGVALWKKDSVFNKYLVAVVPTTEN